ncbi:hypothetical protein ACHAW6_012472 [Cyclotella cf. meneghiniana]
MNPSRTKFGRSIIPGDLGLLGPLKCFYSRPHFLQCNSGILLRGRLTTGNCPELFRNRFYPFIVELYNPVRIFMNGGQWFWVSTIWQLLRPFFLQTFLTCEGFASSVSAFLVLKGIILSPAALTDKSIELQCIM